MKFGGVGVGGWGRGRPSRSPGSCQADEGTL